jgi:hypothetical protein
VPRAKLVNKVVAHVHTVHCTTAAWVRFSGRVLRICTHADAAVGKMGALKAKILTVGSLRDGRAYAFALQYRVASTSMPSLSVCSTTRVHGVHALYGHLAGSQCMMCSSH